MDTKKGDTNVPPFFVSDDPVLSNFRHTTDFSIHRPSRSGWKTWTVRCGGFWMPDVASTDAQQHAA
jgi:hypothetical protein